MPEPQPRNKLDFQNTRIAFQNKSDKELKKTSRLFKLMNNSTLVSLGSHFTLSAFKLRLPLVKEIVKSTFFEQFCGGEHLLDCQQVIDKLYRFNTLTILDYGAEYKSSEEELNQVTEEIMRALEFAASNNSVPAVSTKLTGLADNELFVKLQEGDTLTKAEDRARDRLEKRLHSLCRKAKKMGVSIFFDAEESWLQDAMDELVTKMMEEYNKEKAVVSNTVQLYRHDRLQFLKEAHARAQSKGYFLGIKLVRGAYMNKERLRAQENGYESPIQSDKEATDHDYNEAVKYCVENFDTILSCNASHNLESNLLQAELMVENGILPNHPNLNFSQLYGMADYITFNLAEAGFNVAKYIPYGPVKEVIPYLIRRAQENAAVTGEMSRELHFITLEMKRRGLI